MRVLSSKEDVKFLGNAEALVHIRDVHAQGLQNPQYGDHTKAKMRRLHAIFNDVNTHFQETGLSQQNLPISQPPTDDTAPDTITTSPATSSVRKETQHIPVVMDYLNNLPRASQLTKQEKSMIINTRPTSVIELECIIEELEQRLGGDEEVEKFLEGLGDAFERAKWWGDVDFVAEREKERAAASPEAALEDGEGG